jgi:dynein heavy chain
MGNVLKIVDVVQKQIKEFQPKVPLMVALRKEGMKERHWINISEKVGFEVKPGEEFTFQKCLDMGLMSNIDSICDIGEKAEKEFNIENMLNSMFKIWEDINFDIVEYKTSFIVRGVGEVQAILDEHIVNT